MAEVENNRAEGRYELQAGASDEPAIAAYRLDGDTITFTHTAVPEAMEGHGVGSKLVTAALDDARAQGLRVVAQCEFVAAFIGQHPAYGDLLADPAR